MSNITKTVKFQNLILNFIGKKQFCTLSAVFKLINQCHGNIINSKISQFGDYSNGMLLIQGRWDAILKIEQALDSFSQELDIAIIHQRVNNSSVVKQNAIDSNNPTKEQQDNNSQVQLDFLPYKISIHNLDEPGLLDKMTSFFHLQDITIQELSSNSYTNEFNAVVTKIDIKIKIPCDVHIPSLKEQFDILCYNENLDAYLIPCKI